jgi:selenide, water dikinase
MAHLGEVAFVFRLADLPLLPFAEAYAMQGIFPGGKGRNEAAYTGFVTFEMSAEAHLADLIYDPQTSGGLLLAVPPVQADAYLRAMADAGEPAWLVGEVVPGEAGQLYIR